MNALSSPVVLSTETPGCSRPGARRRFAGKGQRALGVLLLAGILSAAHGASSDTQFLRLPVKEYRDKMKGGWIGQIAGVSWGAPTEFKWQDKIIPADQMPAWRPSMINDAFGQDDLYVEMTFLRSLEEYGIDVSIRQAGIDFANSGYPLWCANNAGRTNLRRGVAPPDSGHPQFNKCPNDIDYQIEADYSGLIAPGMPQVAIDLGERFGRLMNYGDGVYAGQFMGALYAAAFFESDPVKLARTALAAIPAQSQYAEMVRDMIAWYQADPNDWEKAWRLCQKKYREDPEYQKASNGGIDCKINGAYVLMGLLFGQRDLDQTILISCRSGMDSDCNPSSSAGVLFATIGFAKLPARFNTGLDEMREFSHTAYNFPRLLDVCEKLARQFLVRYGGRIEKDGAGEDVFVIPVRAPKPSALELSWAPGPIANSRFTPEEMAKITASNTPKRAIEAVEKLFPGWKLTDCGPDMDPGLRAEWQGRKNVVATHPLDRETGCKLKRTVDVPAGGKTRLHLVVGHDPQGDFDLIVRAAGAELLRKAVSPATCTQGHWLVQDVDLSRFAGQKVEIELINQPSGWAYEAAYWAEIAVKDL
ncbi:MAG TPA: ADP-ribosylglycohydrolase family protein [Verrucomicrobiota bacterium]|nr:ADP-ribosylglycohydrolase family protein [Verrucomicrobiota bacterium]HRZ38183.1 ADP-ribosylglycohydrolase family protein [Candidatus Paceibacterota bacterium]